MKTRGATCVPTCMRACVWPEQGSHRCWDGLAADADLEAVGALGRNSSLQRHHGWLANCNLEWFFGTICVRQEAANVIHRHLAATQHRRRVAMGVAQPQLLVGEGDGEGRGLEQEGKTSDLGARSAAYLKVHCLTNDGGGGRQGCGHDKLAARCHNWAGNKLGLGTHSGVAE